MSGVLGFFSCTGTRTKLKKISLEIKIHSFMSVEYYLSKTFLSVILHQILDAIFNSRKALFVIHNSLSLRSCLQIWHLGSYIRLYARCMPCVGSTCVLWKVLKRFVINFIMASKRRSHARRPGFLFGCV